MRLPNIQALFQKKTRPKRTRNPILDAVEYRHFRALRAGQVFFVTILLVCMGGIARFLYTHIYSAIGQVQNILLLESEARGEVIDFSTMDSVTAAWQKKYSPSTTAHVTRDPFSVSTVPTTTLPVTTAPPNNP